jgi:hypothetical protein
MDARAWRNMPAHGARRSIRAFTLAGLAAGGMTVQRAGDALMDELRAIGETMTAEWLEAAGEDGQAIVEAFREKVGAAE